MYQKNYERKIGTTNIVNRYSTYYNNLIVTILGAGYTMQVQKLNQIHPSKLMVNRVQNWSLKCTTGLYTVRNHKKIRTKIEAMAGYRLDPSVLMHYSSTIV